MTSHLESCKAGSQERLNQLRRVWKWMKDAPQDHTAIFGGDTNLRDWEVVYDTNMCLPWCSQNQNSILCQNAMCQFLLRVYYDRWRSSGGCRMVSLMCGRCWENQRKADTPGTHPSMITMTFLILYACDSTECSSEQLQRMSNCSQKAWPWLVWRSWSVTISSAITGASFVLSNLEHQKSNIANMHFIIRMGC